MRKIWEKFQCLSLLMAFPLAKLFFIPFSREAFIVYKDDISNENHLTAKKKKEEGKKVEITKYRKPKWDFSSKRSKQKPSQNFKISPYKHKLLLFY